VRGCSPEDPQPHTRPNAYGKTFAKVNFATPLSDLGTDPTTALAFAMRRALPGPLAPKLTALGVAVGPDGKVPVAALLNVVTSGIIQQFFTVNAFAPAKQLEYGGFREAPSGVMPGAVLRPHGSHASSGFEDDPSTTGNEAGEPSEPGTNPELN